MDAFNGWERATWFAKEGDDTSEESTHTWDRNGPWMPRIKEEVEAVRDHAGVLDMPGFSRYALSGDGAAEWLRGQITGALPKAGRMNLAYWADSRGRIKTEMTIIRWGEDDFWLMTAAVALWHDFELLKGNLPADGSLALTNITNDWSTHIVTGPASRDILSGITDGADLSATWMSIQDATVAGKPAKLFRVSFAGELGWEVHTAFDDSPPVYEAIKAAGATPFGMFALNAMRIEKGYRTWKGDLSTDYSMLEAGLDRWVKLDKPQDFPGKAALQAEKQAGIKKRFVTMTVDAGDQDAPYMSTVWHQGEVVGETTSGDWGYRINKSVALGTIRADLAVAGTEVEINIFGKMCKATVQPDQPLWDPENERIRA